MAREARNRRRAAVPLRGQYPLYAAAVPRFHRPDIPGGEKRGWNPRLRRQVRRYAQYAGRHRQERA